MLLLHFNGFGVYCIIGRLCADKFHVDSLVAVSDSHYQAMVVAFDVEDHPAVLENTDATVLLLNRGWLRVKADGHGK